jgi:Cu(I)/Ag(I) efflux system membrane fusion protein
MATRTGWIGRLAIALAAVAIGAGAWYAFERGSLAGGDKQDENSSARKRGAGSADHRGMQMPGMDMGDRSGGSSSEKPDVPNHAVVQISPELQQRIGVTVGKVEEAPLKMSVKTVGIVRPDETKEAQVHLKTQGWVEKLSVNFIGQEVKKGDPLLSIYSPDFLVTQQEYLRARGTKSDKVLNPAESSLADSALRRLELWDVPPEALEELQRTGMPHRTLTLQSPINGTVLEKDVLEGEYIGPQKKLYVIADLSTVWVQAKVYEFELPHIQLGEPATVRLPAVPGHEFTGKVVFVQPVVEEATRTAQVRVELANPERLLKPGMFAHVTIAHTMGEGLLVPMSAVLRSGERSLAYRANDDNRFVSVEVEISPVRFGDKFQILSGLKAGDSIVTSANFLIDSESRLRAGGGGMAGMPGMDMGGMDMGGTKKGGKKQDGMKEMEGMKGMDMKGREH